jgi:hypothetical protein
MFGLWELTWKLSDALKYYVPQFFVMDHLNDLLKHIVAKLMEEESVHNIG